MTEKTQVIPEIVDLIIESLNLHFIKKDEVTAATPLMADGLGLDSVDILEVVVAIEQRYNVKIKNAEQGQQVFRNIGTVADFVLSQSTPSVGNAPQQQL